MLITKTDQNADPSHNPSKSNQKTEELSDHKALFPNCHWVSKKDEKRNNKRNNTPCKRWGHSVILYENQMFLFGGSGNNNNSRNWETIYILNCDTYEWEKVCPNDVLGTNTPEPRDSHACVRIGNNMYIFGGSNGENPLNDMFAFNLISKTWNKIDTTGDIPAPREGHSGVALYDRYFFIFGGWNGKLIFQNCYLFDCITNKWKIIEYAPGTEPLPRESHSCALIQDNIYIFGGQGTSIKKKDTYYNDLFKFKITIDKSLEKVTGVWEKITSSNEIYPSPRTSHSTVAYKERYLIVIGGEGYSSNNEFVNAEEAKLISKENGNEEINEESDDEDHPPCFPKSDIWIFDTIDLSWNLLKANNSEIFMPRFTHSCALYKDSLIIFGGLKDFKNSIDDLMVLMLEDIDPKKPIHLCSCCKRMLDYSQVEESQNLNLENGKAAPELKNFEVLPVENKEPEIFEFISDCKPFISLSVLPMLINLNKSPLSAFGLLVDNALSIESKELKIQWKKKYRLAYALDKIVMKDTEHIENFITVEYKDIKNLDFFNERFNILEGFLSFIEGSNPYHTFFRNLKLAGLILGDTLLLVLKRGTIIELFYLSSNLKNNPDLNDFITLDCFWDTSMKAAPIVKDDEDEQFYYSILIKSKKNILDNISHVLSEQDLVDITTPATLFVFNLKKNGFQKKTFTELMSKNDDICVRLPRSIDEEYKGATYFFSLKNYLRYFFVDPPKDFKIFLNGNLIDWNSTFFKHYLNKLEKLPNDLKLCVENIYINRNSPPPENMLMTENLEEIKEKEQQSNHGVFLYNNNRLISKLERKKFDSKIQRIFNEFYGFIEIKQNYFLDFSNSNFESLALKTFFYNSLNKYLLEEFIKDNILDQNSKKRKSEGEELMNLEPHTKKILNN